jgi:DNA repair photolyase
MGPRPLSDDDVIRRCKIVYVPKGQAGEYAAFATNPYRGCGHACAYCYVPLVTHQPRPEFDAGAIPRENYLRRLRADCERYESRDLRVQVMLSFTTDIYNPVDRSITRPALEILIEHGLAICPLTKGGARALADLDLFRPDRDAFAATLTTLDDAFSRKWERAAALPDDRISTLRKFHDRGIFTWVSLEPTLDVDHSLAVVDATHEFVDLYKVGRANYVPTITKVLDWRDYTLRMIERLQRYGNAHYIKRDLQPYLPPGYSNPLRVPQHH